MYTSQWQNSEQNLRTKIILCPEKKKRNIYIYYFTVFYIEAQPEGLLFLQHEEISCFMACVVYLLFQMAVCR